jgi:predicted PurR-regulated permease PerM
MDFGILSVILAAPITGIIKITFRYIKNEMNKNIAEKAEET